MDMITVRVETEINPTETEEKVEKAVSNIFNDASAEVRQSYKRSILYATAEGCESLIKLRNLLSSDRIRDAARKVFFRGLRGNTIQFCLNKQVAFVGHISFSGETGESPLGPIKVTIESDDPQQLIDWVASRTT
jgi:predicted RNA binding protein with dsRBD fold (UPF0201 family)